MEYWSSERWSNFPKDTQPVRHRIRIQTQVLEFNHGALPYLLLLALLRVGRAHTLLASALLSLWESLSSPKRSVIACILLLLVWECCSWTCAIYLRICKAVSCLLINTSANMDRKLALLTQKWGQLQASQKKMLMQICIFRRGPGLLLRCFDA